MKESRLKCHFFLIHGFLGHFSVEKLGVKNWPKVRLTPYKNANFWQKMAIFREIFFERKTSPNGSK